MQIKKYPLPHAVSSVLNSKQNYVCGALSCMQLVVYTRRKQNKYYPLPHAAYENEICAHNLMQ